jgi:hypothetical protein
MTFFHFGNCVALAYAPYVILYRTSALSEYSALWKCVKAGAAYLVTQLCKMMFLATFFPTSDLAVAGQFDILTEFLKSTVDLADLFGLHLIMSKVAGRGQLKFMIAGVGWASAELIATGFWPLWVGARGIEFDWKYIQMSLDSNISLVQHVSTAALVWLYGRTDLKTSSTPLVLLLLGLSCYRPLIVEVLMHSLEIGSWSVLLLKLIYTSVIGVLTLNMSAGLSTKDSHY